MKIVSQSEQEATIRVTRDEVQLIQAIMAEVQTGPNQIEDEEWDASIGLSRKLEDQLVSELTDLVHSMSAS